MKPGDVCEIEVDKVGVLRNPIEDDALRLRRPPPLPRTRGARPMAGRAGEADHV